MALHRRQHAELEARCSRDAIRTGEMISRITTMRIENDALLLQRPPVAGHAALIAENTRIKAELDRSRSTSADELAQYGAHLYAVENEAAWLRQTLLEESQGLAGANAEMLRAKDEYSTQVESAREDQAAIVRSDLGARDVHAELLLQVEENQTMRTSHQQIRVELQVAQAEVQSAEAGKCDLGRSLTQVVRQCTEMREQLRAAEAGQGAHPRHPGHPGAELGELREHLVRAQMAAEEHEADARGTHEALSNESIIAQILAERLAEHETQEASRRYPGGYEPRPTASTQRYLLSPHPVSAPAKQEEDEPPDGVELSGQDKEMNAYFTRRRLLEMRDEDPAALLLEEIRGARLDVLVYAGLAGKSPLLSDDRVVDALKQRASESVAVRIILGEEHAAWAEVDELRAYDISIRCGKRVDGPYVMIDGCRALQRVDSGEDYQWELDECPNKLKELHAVFAVCWNNAQTPAKLLQRAPTYEPMYAQGEDAHSMASRMTETFVPRAGGKSAKEVPHGTLGDEWNIRAYSMNGREYQAWPGALMRGGACFFAICCAVSAGRANVALVHYDAACGESGDALQYQRQEPSQSVGRRADALGGDELTRTRAVTRQRVKDGAQVDAIRTVLASRSLGCKSPLLCGGEGV